MATTTANMHMQLTTETAQPNTTEPSLKTRELARFLAGAIHYYYKDHFYAKLNEGGDPNFTGLDDRGLHVNPPLLDAIAFNNTWAFDELLRRSANIHKAGKGTNVPLFEAAARGNPYMVRELLKQGADPLDYRKGTCLPLLLETIWSSALFESQSRWRYENESPETDNVALKQQMLDFHLQEGAYTPPQANTAVLFVVPEHVIHVHFKGKLEILGLLLARHVSPTIPVSGTTRSALAIVQNPAKYYDIFRSDDKEQLEYIGTEEEYPNTLLFNMTLVNKRNTGTSSRIVVHYDLEPSRKLIEGAVAHLNPHLLAVTESLSKGMQETGNRLGTQLSSAQEELKEKLEKAQAETARLQAQLAAAQNETKHLADTVNGVGEAVKKVDAAVKGVDEATKKVDKAVQDVGKAVHLEERQEIARFTALINDHPNAKEAYKSFKTGLEAIHTSAQAVMGGLATVSEGPCSLVASALGMSTELVDMIPVIGSAASKLFGLASATAKEIDKRRQTNLSENIAVMVTAKEARKTFEAVARKLTIAYLPQFERLATKENAQAYMSRTQQSLQNAKNKALKSRFKSPAEQVTAFAIIWMMDEVFNKANRLDQEMAEKGLEALLLNAVTQHKPEERLTTFWDEITANLGINAIPTQNAAGETWRPADFWTGPGVMVQNNHDVQYFAGAHTNAAKFGWRSGSLEDVEALDLMPTAETAPLTPPTVPLVNSGPVPPAPSSRDITYAYTNQTPPPMSRNPEPYETKADKDKLDLPTPSAPKRGKSPFSGLKLPGFRRGACPAPILHTPL